MLLQVKNPCNNPLRPPKGSVGYWLQSQISVPIQYSEYIQIFPTFISDSFYCKTNLLKLLSTCSHPKHPIWYWTLSNQQFIRPISIKQYLFFLINWNEFWINNVRNKSLFSILKYLMEQIKFLKQLSLIMLIINNSITSLVVVLVFMFLLGCFETLHCYSNYRS